MSEAERFWAKVQKGPGCWLWTGTKHSGYGRHGRVGAHRAAYEMTVGPIPKGLEIDHLCRVRDCVRPSHLEAVTKRVNILRSNCPQAINARKTHCDYGHAFAENSRRNKWGRICIPCHERNTEKCRIKKGVKHRPEGFVSRATPCQRKYDSERERVRKIVMHEYRLSYNDARTIPSAVVRYLLRNCPPSPGKGE